MREAPAFQTLIDEWVSVQLTAPMAWDDLLYVLPGVYPATAWDSVRRLSLGEMVSFGSRSPAEDSFAERIWDQGELPTPHPQDGVWWFADAALDRLLGELGELVPYSGRGALLLGTPTLFHYTKLHNLRGRVLLLDRDSQSVRQGQFRVHTCDLFGDTSTDEEFDIVVADPPWYPLETRAFLLAALRRCRKGTRVLLSVPGLGTRPGIRQEWQDLIRWAEHRGLRLLDYEMRALPYISPLFERNALRTAGIRDYPADWRRGDLATFEADGSFGGETLAGSGQSRWKEVQFGRIRFRIQGDSFAGWRNPRLHPVVLGDILPSVSRRDARLKSVAVWTSGNRIFDCKGCFVLSNIMEAMSMGDCVFSRLAAVIGEPLDEAQREEVRNAIAQLSGVIALEQEEIEDWRTLGNDDMVELPAHQS